MEVRVLSWAPNQKASTCVLAFFIGDSRRGAKPLGHEPDFLGRAATGRVIIGAVGFTVLRTAAGLSTERAVCTAMLLGKGTMATPRGPSTKAVSLPGASVIDAKCWQLSPLASGVTVQPTGLDMLTLDKTAAVDKGVAGACVRSITRSTALLAGPLAEALWYE